MQESAVLLTTEDLAQILSITPYTLHILVENSIIPHMYIQEPVTHNQILRFNSSSIIQWMHQKPKLDLTNKNYITKLNGHFLQRCSDTMKRLHLLDSQVSPRQTFKYYNLTKVPNKKYGFLYYVRYVRNGKMINSRWNTHTNNRFLAEKYALENRDQILAAYDAKKTNMYSILGSYYLPDSPYYAMNQQRGKTLSPKTRSVYIHFIKKVFIPFLKSNGVSNFNDVTPPIIAKFQTNLLQKGNKPQTINRYLSALKEIFNCLVMDGILTENTFTKIQALKEKNHHTSRGCYEIEKLKGVFNHTWQNETAYMLNILIYSTGLRNNEIARLRVEDIITLQNCFFFDIKKSKTKNGIRIVPLHPFVYRQIQSFIKKMKKQPGDYLFSKKGYNQSTVYKSACLELGERLGMTETNLNEEHITFYSGRHYWKTLMNSEDLGDIEEYFMGHKVTRDVRKRYNHLDKQGREKLTEKAYQVFSILERRLFGPLDAKKAGAAPALPVTQNIL